MYQDGPTSAYNQVPFCLICSPICLLYRVIQDFVQKAQLSEIQTIKSEWVTMYDKGLRHKTALNKCKSAQDMQNCYVNRQNDV